LKQIKTLLLANVSVLGAAIHGTVQKTEKRLTVGTLRLIPKLVNQLWRGANDNFQQFYRPKSGGGSQSSLLDNAASTPTYYLF
jgi:hypothetical protein